MPKYVLAINREVVNWMCLPDGTISGVDHFGPLSASALNLTPIPRDSV
jgi:hypothetical protein